MVGIFGSVDSFSTTLPQSSEPTVSGASASSSFAMPVLPGIVSGALNLKVAMDMPDPHVVPANSCGPSLIPKRSFRRSDKHPNSKKCQIIRAAQHCILQMIAWFHVPTSFHYLYTLTKEFENQDSKH